MGRSSARANVSRRAADTPKTDEATRDERTYWESIKLSTDAEDFRAYLKKYPNGQFADLARNRLGSPESSTSRLPDTTGTNFRIPAYQDTVLLDNRSFTGIDLDDSGNLYWVDIFSGTLGTFEPANGRTATLLSGLRGPLKIRVFGSRVYFVESGTFEKRYKDGRLSYLDVNSNKVHQLLEDLNYPNSLYVTPSEDVYFAEAGASSTSYGGVSQVCVLRKGAAQKVVVWENVLGVEGIVVDSRGALIVGIMGLFRPGETGQLQKISPNIPLIQTVLLGLSAPTDLDLDQRGNIYIAGMGDEKLSFTGITLASATAPYHSTPLRQGVFVWCLAVDKNGDIYYSTLKRGGITSNSVRVLRTIR